MSTDEYHPSASSSGNWLWKVSKVGFTLKGVYNLPKHCLQKSIIFNGLPSKLNPSLKRAGPQKRFKFEEIP